jgi:hypothetical protein
MCIALQQYSSRAPQRFILCPEVLFTTYARAYRGFFYTKTLVCPAAVPSFLIFILLVDINFKNL